MFILIVGERGSEICEFSTGRKVRICAVGLSAKEYRDEITFLPREDKIEPRCEKKTLNFDYSSGSRSKYFDFSEWVIGCKAEVNGEKNSSTYYVSLGYEPYQFLIYHPEKTSTGINLIHHFYSHLGMDNSKYSRD